MWESYLVQVLIGLFSCFGGSGKRGKNCHCMMHCDITTPEQCEKPKSTTESIEQPAETTIENQ